MAATLTRRYQIPADPERYELAVTRYQAFVIGQRQRQAVAMASNAAYSAPTAPRPRYWYWMVDWAITPAVWCMSLVLLAYFPWFSILYAIQLFTLVIFSRWPSHG